MKNKIQILHIHGGGTFKSRADYLSFLREAPVSIEKKVRWSGEWLEKKLGPDFEIIKPSMPLKENARYSDWKIYFERFFPYLHSNIILIGNSLGGIFLAKYLSENKFPKKILSVYLVCPPFDGSLSDEALVGGFKLGSDLSLIEKNCRNVNLLFSQNDDVVPVAHAEKYARKLKNSNILVFPHIKGHFKVAEFPEIVKMIKDDVKKLRK